VRRTILAVGLGLALCSVATAGKKPHYGVFATINGKKLNAASYGTADPCVFGFYQATGGITFSAVECRGPRHRLPRRTYQQVVFACGALQPPATPPFEAACVSQVYTEGKIRRLGAFTQNVWAGSNSFELGPDNTPIEHSSVRLFIDSFDGTYVSGRFSGVFDMPQQPGTPTQAAISGEGHFDFPVRGVQ